MPPLETISKSRSTRPWANSSKPGLVVDGDQCALHAATGGVSLPSRNSLTACGSSRCSTSWIRSCRYSIVSPSRTSTASCSDDRAGVDARVDEVHGRAGDLAAVRKRVRDRVHAREGREQGRVHVQDPAGKALEERRGQQPHVAGEDDELDSRARRASPPSARRGARGNRTRSTGRRPPLCPPPPPGRVPLPSCCWRRPRRRAGRRPAEPGGSFPPPEASTPITGSRRSRARPRPGRPARPRSSRCRG